MSDHSSDHAIELTPAARPHPTLALVLALLTVPGSTVAWALPEGGLWVGLPLGLAAIVLALRARRENVGRGRATAALVIAGLCITNTAVWTLVDVVT